jgi:hypothetical protein
VSEAAIPAGLEPLWVGDANSREWYRFFGSEQWRHLVDWLRSEGFDEGITHRVEIFLLDAPFARIHHYIPNERGYPRLNDTRDDVLSKVTTILLSSLPSFVNRESE